MFGSVERLQDRSAAGVARAADEGHFTEEEQGSRLVEEARALLEEGRGDWVYIGSIGEAPQWEPPSGDKAQEPPPERGLEREPEQPPERGPETPQ